MCLFCVKDLIKTYGDKESEIVAIKNASLIINKQDTISISGPSGAGKSTLLNLLGGIVKPDGGEIIYNNISYSNLKDKKMTELRLNEFGLIFQNYLLIPSLSVKDNILLPSIVKNRKADKKEFDELVELLGLESRLSHYPNQLSGGEKQRTAIARAVLASADVFFADEPTGNLDSKNSEKVFELLFFLVKRYKKTLIYVTHDEQKAQMASRRFYIKDGVLSEIS